MGNLVLPSPTLVPLVAHGTFLSALPHTLSCYQANDWSTSPPEPTRSSSYSHNNLWIKEHVPMVADGITSVNGKISSAKFSSATGVLPKRNAMMALETGAHTTSLHNMRECATLRHKRTLVDA